MARTGIRSLISLVALCSAVAGATAGAGAGAAIAPVPRLHGINVLGRDLDRPVAVASDGTHVWVVNDGNSTVSMLSAATGRTIRTIDVPAIGSQSKGSPAIGITADGSHVWIAGGTANDVTEIVEGTGAVIRVIRAPAYGLSGPTAIASDGVDAWVADESGNSVTEIGAMTGGLARLLHGGAYGFNHPSAIAFDGTNLWVLNAGSGAVTEIDAATGGLVQTIPASAFGGSSPSDLAVVGAHLWVVDAGSDEISLIATATGTFSSVLDGGARSFQHATGLAVAGAYAWVVGSTPSTGRQLTELRASNGGVVRIVTQPSRTSWSSAVADDGAHLWVVDAAGNGLTELSATSGGAVRVTYGAPYELSTPDAITTIDGHVWVANAGDPPVVGDSLLEFDASSGAFVRQVVGLTIAAPRELTACGGHLWLGSGYGSVVELNASNGRVVRTFADADPHAANVQAFACGNGDLWVVDTAIKRGHYSTTIDELSGAGGKQLRRISLPGEGAAFPNSVVVADGELWVTASSHDSLTVVSTTTGAIVRTYVDTGAIRSGGAVLASSTDVFVADFNAIVELDASTGAVVRVIRGPKYHLDLPFAFVADGQALFVVNAGNSVTELSMRTGALLHVFDGPAYGFDDPVCATRAGPNLWIGNALGQSITEFPAR